MSAGAAGAAGASVCRCPVHSQPGWERLIHEPGLRWDHVLPEGPGNAGLSEQPGPAEEPPPAAAHRVTSLLPTFASSASHFCCTSSEIGDPVAVSASPFGMDEARTFGRVPSPTGLAVPVTLLGWGRGYPAPVVLQPTT